MEITLQQGQKVYFVSDAHFGLPNREESLVRERKMIQWVEETRVDAAAYFLVGDIFDYWWEYKRSVPSGFVRLLAKFAELVESGIPVHFFWGNHDMWCRHNYFASELGWTVHQNELEVQINNKLFFIHHGDGLGGKDVGYNLLKWGFRNKFLQWGFSQLHPDFGQWLGHTWSSHRKYGQHENVFYNEGEFLVDHARAKLKNKHYDFFVHGHRHTPVVYKLSEQSAYVNTGDWLQHFTYGVFDGNFFHLLNYPEGEDFSDYSLQFSEKDV